MLVIPRIHTTDDDDYYLSHEDLFTHPRAPHPWTVPADPPFNHLST